MRDSLVGVLLLAQWALALAWQPFRLVARALALCSNSVHRLGDALFRPPYWAVVQAKRRRLGLPLWQDHDWRIGIGPACESCGAFSPPGRHRVDCAFLRPSPIVDLRPPKGG